MLKYLFVILDDVSISFCHYKVDKDSRNLISLENLKKAIMFGMKENLMIQFIYPDYELPKQYSDLINSTDHVKIKPFGQAESQDICVAKIDDIGSLPNVDTIVIRGSIKKFHDNMDKIMGILYNHRRINITIDDMDTIDSKDIDIYADFLNSITDFIVSETKQGKELPQLNVLTDRLSLESMNNCNAGIESLTIGPDGNFYICPAFYYDGFSDISGTQTSPSIPNPQLYRLDHAPICRECDAYQCHRCVWLNKKKTLEVNTPGHMQCLISHIERNASRTLLNELHNEGISIVQEEIPEIDYLDPFEKIKR